MNRKEHEVIRAIISNYFNYREKSDKVEAIANEDDGKEGTGSSKGIGKRPEVIASKAERAQKVERNITQEEREARELLWMLTECERICVVVWEDIKNKTKKGTGDRYRKADIIPELRKQGLPFDKQTYDIFKEHGEMKLILAHKVKYPNYWKESA